MSFRAVELEYRRHAERIRLRHQKRMTRLGPCFMTEKEVAGIAYYLVSAEQVWNLQREKVLPGAGFKMRGIAVEGGGVR